MNDRWLKSQGNRRKGPEHTFEHEIAFNKILSPTSQISKCQWRAQNLSWHSQQTCDDFPNYFAKCRDSDSASLVAAVSSLPVGFRCLDASLAALLDTVASEQYECRDNVFKISVVGMIEFGSSVAWISHRCDFRPFLAADAMMHASPSATDQMVSSRPVWWSYS